MAEELQSLLERINRDGVEQANAAAQAIIAGANTKAEGILRDAQQKAEQVVAKARQEETLMVERGGKALEQAARDVILSVGEMLNRVVQGLATAEVARAMDTATLGKIIATVVDGYCQRHGNARLEILVSPADQKALSSFFMGKFAAQLRDGLELKGDASLVSGFKVSVKGQDVQHDFSAAAIAEAMAQLLRPQLAEITRKAAGR